MRKEQQFWELRFGMDFLTIMFRFDTLYDKLCSVKIFHVYNYKGDSNEMESKLNWSSVVNLILTLKSVIYMFIAIVLEYENNSYTCKLHLYSKSFIKLTPGVVRDLVV